MGDTAQEEDKDGNQYAFVECLRDLVLNDRDEYFDELEEAICEQDLESDGLVNVVRKDAPHADTCVFFVDQPGLTIFRSM